jgi:alanyl-tRNA synthetase
MISSEVRNKFLDFFEKRGHKVLPGSSLVPSDPTVLLTLAGMLQFKPIFLGQEKPAYRRAATVQKCLRTNDIEQVGKTARHHTFFEMLGNFSFGDYFKKEAIQFAWELIVGEFKLPTEKLLVAVFEQDDEAFSIWNKNIGLPAEQIYRLGEENNFWAVGPTGPCGPCSEIYYDLGAQKGCGKPDCKPGCDCDRFLEIWNLVFIQFNRNEKGELIPLKSKGIDTGMGLERITSVLQGVDSNFDTDLFLPLIDEIKKKTKQTSPSQVSLNIISDHVRAATHLISDGVIPENGGRGYVLRRLIRRAVRHGKLLGIDGPFLHLLSKVVIDQMKDVYPNLGKKEKEISKILKTEEEHFLATLEQGMALFKDVMEKYQEQKVIPGEALFKLHDTYGFPLELSKEIAAEAGFKIDEKGFDVEMEGQRERARAAGMSSEKKKVRGLNLEKIGASKFLGYEKNSELAKIQVIFPEEKFVVLEKTPFYGESGGQVGDKGVLKFGSKQVKVLDTQLSANGVVLHEVENVEGMKERMKVEAIIDLPKRHATEIHHTATHLLHKALKEVLGDHVKQAGSHVGPDKLRFDFTHFSAMSHEEIEKVEEIVNQKIREQLEVEVLQKTYNEAIKMGAVALFGEKYGEKVRVLKIGDYSLELCGGTHVKSTADIMFFKIISESALGAGVKRIEAVGGEAAKNCVLSKARFLRLQIGKLIRDYQLLQEEKERLGGKKFEETGIFEVELTELQSISRAVANQDAKNVNKFLDHLQGRSDWLKERVAKAEKEINEMKIANVAADVSSYINEMREHAGVKVLTKEFKRYGMDMLRSISDAVQKEVKSCVLVLVSLLPGRVAFLITVTQDLVNKGITAKNIAEVFGQVIGGRGGGRDNKVEGGGKDPARVKEGFDAVIGLLGS